MSQDNENTDNKIPPPKEEKPQWSIFYYNKDKDKTEESQNKLENPSPNEPDGNTSKTKNKTEESQKKLESRSPNEPDGNTSKTKDKTEESQKKLESRSPNEPDGNKSKTKLPCFRCKKTKIYDGFPGKKGKTMAQAEEVKKDDNDVKDIKKDDNDVKLIIKLEGSMPARDPPNIYFNNVRIFLLLLIEIIYKKRCVLLIPNDNKSLIEFLQKINNPLPKHKKLVFKKDCKEELKNIKEKTKTKECILLCNKLATKEYVSEIENNKPFLFLKGSGDSSEYVAELQQRLKDSETEERKSKERNDTESVEQKLKKSLDATDDTIELIKKKITVQNINTYLDIGVKLKENDIIQQIVQGIVDCEINNKKENTELELLILCVKLNQLDIADNSGCFWNLFLQENGDSETNEKRKKVLLHALKLKRYNFIRYLTQQGVHLEEYLTEKDILNPNHYGKSRYAESQPNENNEVGEKKPNENNEVGEKKPNENNEVGEKKPNENNEVGEKKPNENNKVGEKKPNKKKKESGWIKLRRKYYEERKLRKKENDSEQKDNANCCWRRRRHRRQPATEQTSLSREDIFILSVLEENFELALVIWRTIEHPTQHALYAIEIITQMKSLIDPEHLDYVEKLDKTIQEFEKIAIDTINNTYKKYEHEHQENIWELLTYENRDLRNTNCIMLALRNYCGNFLSQPPCQKLNQSLWRSGKLPEKHNDDKKNTWCTIGQDVNAILSPSIVVLFRFMGHITFLVLFAMWLVSVLDVSTFGWMEWLLWSWILSYCSEFVNQWKRNPMKRSISRWNLFDWIELAALVLFILTWLLRAAAFAYQEYHIMMTLTRVFFSVDYIMFCMLTLEFCCTNRFLGPKLIMITTM